MENDTVAGEDPIFHITAEDYAQLTFIANVCISPAICALGLVGNCLGAGVLWRDSRNQTLTIYFYLCCLTTLDAVYLFFGIVRSVPVFLRFHDKYLASYLESQMQLCTIYLDMLFTYSATTIMLVMAVERFNALIRPFSVKDSILSKHPKKIVIACFTGQAIFLCPYAIYFEVASFEDHTNQTEYYINFQPDATDLMTRYMVVQTIVNNYIPGVISLVVNFGIPIAFARVVRSRRQLNVSSHSMDTSQQVKITFSVFAISFAHLMFNLPDLFIKTLGFFDQGYTVQGEYVFAFWLFMDLVNLFTYLNAANDFVIYILISDHYRKIFKQMYCGCSYKEREQNCLTNDNKGHSSSVATNLSVTDKY